MSPISKATGHFFHHLNFTIQPLSRGIGNAMPKIRQDILQMDLHGFGHPETRRITMPDHTFRIARLKMLFVAAKIRSHGNRDEARYSMHEQRSGGLIDFLDYLDRRRKEVRAVA